MNKISITMRGLNRTEFPVFATPDPSYSASDLRLLASWKAYFDIPKWLSKTIPVASFAVGAVANMFTLVYFIRSGKSRVPLFTLFTSLAICDLLTCLATCSLAQGVYPDIIFPVAAKQLAIMSHYIVAVAFGASVLHLIFLACLRYYQLCYPLNAKIHVTFTWVLRWCVAMWVIAIIIHIAWPFHRDVRTISYNNRTVSLFIFTGNMQVKNILASMFLQVIPLFIIAALHLLKIYKMIVKYDLQNKGGRNVSSRMAALILIVFVLSMVMRLAHDFSHVVLRFPNQAFHKLLVITAARIQFSSSIINPFIYTLGSADMRKDICKTFCTYSNTKK